MRLEPENLCTDACAAPADPGPCNGTFSRWAFDKETRSCRQFDYGGCKGNKNNFPTEAACLYKCNKPGESRGTSSFLGSERVNLAFHRSLLALVLAATESMIPFKH